MKLAEQALGRFDERDRCRREREIGVVLAEDAIDQLSKPAGNLDPSRPATDENNAGTARRACMGPADIPSVCRGVE